MKKFLFHEPVLHLWIRYIWDCSVQEFIEYLDKEVWVTLSSSHDNSVWLTVSCEWQYPFIWLKNKYDMSVVVHEILHAVRAITEATWLKLSSETEEIFAYYQEFLFNCYLEWVLWKKWKIDVRYWVNNELYSLVFTEKDSNKKLWALKKKERK